MIKVNESHLELCGDTKQLIAEYLHLTNILFKELNDYEKDRTLNTIKLISENKNLEDIMEETIKYNIKSKTKETFDTLGLSGKYLKD